MSFLPLDLFCHLLLCRLCIIVVGLLLVYSSYLNTKIEILLDHPPFSSLVQFFRRIRLRDMVLEYCRIGFLPALGYLSVIRKKKESEEKTVKYSSGTQQTG